MSTTALKNAGSEDAWGLDGLGNFATFQEADDGQGWDLDQERDVNAANEITGIDEGQYQDAWITPEYDAAGNMVSGPAPGDETARLHFRYDAWNRLVKVYADDAQNPGEPGDVVVEYTYDGQKRRIEKALADGTSIESYYNAGWQLLEERFLDESQEPAGADQYVWSPRYIDAPILRDRYDENEQLDADARLYYLGDANFNVTALVGEDPQNPGTWEVTERYAYDPYGKAVVYDADWANPAAPTTDGPLYAGYRFDAETGLYIARNRLYHSTLATWTTRDPLGYAAGDVNLYRYCGNSPLQSTDSTGLASEETSDDRNDMLIRVDAITVTGCRVEITTRRGGPHPISLPAPLSPGLPSTNAVSEALLKTALNAILRSISVSGLGKIIRTQFLAIQVEEETILDRLAFCVDVSVDATVHECVPVYERRWYTLWLWDHDTGESVREEKSKTLSLQLRLVDMNLEDGPEGINAGSGIGVFDPNGLDWALNEFKSKIERRLRSLGERVTKKLEGDYPNATIEPLAP